MMLRCHESRHIVTLVIRCVRDLMLRALGLRRCEVLRVTVPNGRPASSPHVGLQVNLSPPIAGSAKVRTCHRTGRVVLRHRPPTPQNAQVILSLDFGGMLWGHEAQERTDWCVGGASRTSRRPVGGIRPGDECFGIETSCFHPGRTAYSPQRL